MWRAFTCTALTALNDESTRPFVNDSNTLDCAATVSPPGLSFGTEAFEGKFRPNPLLRREKADLVAFPFSDFSVAADKCCGSLRPLAQEDMDEADNIEDESGEELTSSDSMDLEGSTSEALLEGGIVVSAGLGSILQTKQKDQRTSLSELIVTKTYL